MPTTTINITANIPFIVNEVNVGTTITDALLINPSLTLAKLAIWVNGTEQKTINNISAYNNATGVITFIDTFYNADDNTYGVGLVIGFP